MKSHPAQKELPSCTEEEEAYLRRFPASRRMIAKELLELKQVASAYGDVLVERGTWSLDRQDERDVDLIRAFELAGLNPKKPAHQRRLLEVFVGQFFAKTRGAKTYRWTEKDYVILLHDAFEAHRHLTSKGKKPTRLEACEHILKARGDAHRVKARYRDPKEKNKPRTLLRQLERILAREVLDTESATMVRDYEHLPNRLQDIRDMRSYLLKHKK